VNEVRRIHTTLNIDDEVLEAARKIAAERRVSVGQVISDFARQELAKDPETRHRLKVLPD
jgi:hypothetical protein